jgi:hypothetical protein
VIEDLDASISAWLSTVAPYASISLESPDAVSATDPGDRPTLTLQLLDVREDQAAGTLGWSTLRNEDGVAVNRLPPNRRYRFTFLVSAVAADAGTEHAALGTVLVGLSGDDVVPEKHLRGALSDCAGELVVRCAPAREDSDRRDRWAPWHLSGYRTALELEVLAPLPQAAVHDVVAPPSHFELHSAPRYPGRAPADGAPAATPRRPITRIVEPDG